MLPTEMVQAGDVEEFAGGAVGAGGVEDELTGVADDTGDFLGEVGDGEFFAGADVDVQFAVVIVHEVDAGVGQVVDVHELAQGFAAAPDLDLR